MSDHQLTPDAMSTQQENELICAKLLGWELRPRFGNNPRELYRPDGSLANEPLTFTTWAETGLILDALAARELVPGLEHDGLEWICALRDSMVTGANTGPLAVRAAALEYIKAVKS